jgi:hypothetical protein
MERCWHSHGTQAPEVGEAAGLWGVSAHRPSTTYALAVLHPSKLPVGHWVRRGSRPPCLFPAAVRAWASPKCVFPRLTSSESEASHSLDVSLFLPSSQAERCWPALGAAVTGVHDPRPPAPPFCMPAAGGTPLPQAFCVSLAAVCACRSMARQLQLLFPVGRPLSESRDSATLRIVAHRWAFLPPLAHLLFLCAALGSSLGIMAALLFLLLLSLLPFLFLPHANEVSSQTCGSVHALSGAPASLANRRALGITRRLSLLTMFLPTLVTCGTRKKLPIAVLLLAAALLASPQGCTAAPVVQRLHPSGGPAAGGTVVTLTGAALDRQAP